MNFILNDHNKKLIDFTFPNLISDHKDLIIKSLNDIFIIILNTIFYKNEEDFIKQMKLNDSRDILGFVTLLLPYFDFSVRETCLKINSFDDIFKDPNPKNELYKQNVFKSTYYLDHDTTNYNLNDYKIYFFNNTQKIINTIKKVKHKLLPNWLNIFPYKLEDLNKIELYINLKEKYSKKIFNEDEDNLDIGYDTLYGTIVNFLYNDIYRIKWMIYDYYEPPKIFPSIIHICELLDLNKILIENYDNSIKSEDNKIFYKLPIERQEELKNRWTNVILNNKNINDLTNLILFYIRVNIYKLDKINISKKCKLYFKLILEDDNEVGDEIEENYKFQNKYSKLCIIELINNIEYADIYEYIFSCLHQFRYTWYGYMCVNSENVVLNKDNYDGNFNFYFEDEFSQFKKKELEEDPIYSEFKPLFSLKLFYNYFKSLVHFHINKVNFEKKDNYVKGGNSWDEININFRKEFKKKFFETDETSIWFNIPNNLKRIPGVKIKNINKIMIIFRKFLFYSNFIPKIIISTLIYNGILTKFIYNPVITSKTELPDKNKEFLKYKNHIKDRLKIKEYENSYHFLSNRQYSSIPNCCEDIKNSFWYGNFGGDWVAQIQIYHHFINQRFMIITAVTGAGKSTVIPFILLYALKMLNYNNNCKLVCTAPRIVPVTKNTKRISDSLGYKYQEIIEIDPETKREKKIIKKNTITYIQFKHAAEDTVDEYYHPKLRFVTDGALYQEVKDKYLFKIDIDNKNYNNLFDIILIDEAHEHNTYIDLILTITRNNLYLNNQITLGIVSATIDYDEPLYRKFFYNINDNLKFPLKFNEFDPFLIEDATKRLDSNLIDRRVNIGAPYTGTNFTIIEKFKKDIDEMIILNEIYKISNKDDILLFKAGYPEILKIVEKINKNSPSHVYALPFYKDLKDEIKNNVEEIADKNIRTNFFRFPKDKKITDSFSVEEMVEPGTYTQFVIVSTNIAEASVTIDSLGFVIDDGKQKTNYYDYSIRNTKLVKETIADPNRLQRKGRVGRVKPGTIYYTYLSSTKDFKEKLDPKVQYKICNEDISTYIINFLNISDEKEINKDNDPSISIDRYNITLPDYLKYQYTCIFLQNINEILTYSYNYLEKKYINKRNYNFDYIYYSYKNSKFDIEDIIDNVGKFFIVHPDDNILIRNKNLEFINKEKINNKLNIVKVDDNGEIILKNKQPIIIKENYINKIEIIINILKENYILDENNKITNLGKLIQDIISEGFITRTESVLCILDIIKNYENIDYNYIIFLIIFMEGTKIELSKDIRNSYFLNEIRSDIINISKLFTKNLLNEIFLHNIDSYKRKEKIKDKLEYIDKEIIRKSNLIFEKYFLNKKKILNDDKINLKNIFENYNRIKIRIEIITNRFELYNKYTFIKEKYVNLDINQNIISEYDNKIIEEFNSDNTNKLYNKQFITISKNIEVNIFNDYEKMCYFVAKYFITNIVTNIPRTSFYLNYINPNVNIIYQINKYTSVNYYYRLNYISYCSNNENKLDIITFIPTKIINKIIKDEKKYIIKNNINLDLKYIKDIYIDSYDKILKKIDIIIQYIRSL